MIKDKLKLQLSEMLKDQNIGLCFSNSVFFNKKFKSFIIINLMMVIYFAIFLKNIISVLTLFY